MHDIPPPTPDQLAAERDLNALIAPVTRELLDAGVNPLRAGFLAYRIVRGVSESDLFARWEQPI